MIRKIKPKKGTGPHTGCSSKIEKFTGFITHYLILPYPPRQHPHPRTIVKEHLTHPPNHHPPTRKELCYFPKFFLFLFLFFTILKLYDQALALSLKVQFAGVLLHQKYDSDQQDDREAFFVVRKGDLIGVYKNLTDCQAQVGSSICDPPVSVYKGCSIPKNTEKYLLSCGLKNALYSVRASNLTEELFGTLVQCSAQQLAASRGETSSEPTAKKRLQEIAWSDYGRRSCTLEFDGASKGNPGQSGAGAILRSDDGLWICRLREGLGVATTSVAEYRGIILGLKYALGKGFTNILVRGDSKLVCMQIQGLWRVKNQNISSLFEEATKLKDRFLSFQIVHILRDLNSEADAQANLAVDLAEGQVQEEIDE